MVVTILIFKERMRLVIEQSSHILGEQRIPRIIHYCWFGRGEQPKLLKKCKASWAKHLANYKLMEWNESNFDIASNRYVKQAYEAKKYAFVSDYARLYALYHFGGIYLDTDVEVVQSLDCFLQHDAFTGFEDHTYLQSGTMGAKQGHPFIKRLLEQYDDRTFINVDGTMDLTTNTMMISKHCLEQGLKADGRYQTLRDGVVVYPRTYFSPYDYIDGNFHESEETYTIHHFAHSWLPLHTRLKGRVKRRLGKMIK